MNFRSVSNATTNRKVFRFISYLLVFLIMVCVVMTIGTFVQNLMPDWHSGVIAGILLFLVIDRLYTYGHLKSLAPLSSEWLIAFGAQWIVILLVGRLLLSYANGVESFLSDLTLFARGYLASFFSAEFVLTIFFAVVIWYLSGLFLGLLDEIGLDQEMALREDPPIQNNIVPAHQRLVNLIFSLGIVLVILTALIRINMRTILANTVGLPSIELSGFSGAETGALFYFVFGLALLSLSRLMSLQTHWNQLRIPISSENLTRQWGKYSIFFLLILAIIVSLLPAGDSLGFFSVLGTLVGFLMGIFFFLAQVILALVAILLSLPFVLFGRNSPFINEGPAAAPLPNLPVPPSAPPVDNETLALIRSIFLWGSLAVIVVLALVHFVRQHGSIRAALRQSRVANWLSLAWQWLRKNADTAREGISRTISAGWQSMVAQLDKKRVLPRMDFIRLRALDPRRQIYFFYLAMVRRGAEQGLTRKSSQTPAEYAALLERALPSAEEDIDAITAAFVEARYSRQEVDTTKAQQTKTIWGRIRRAFQSKAKAEKAARSNYD